MQTISVMAVCTWTPAYERPLADLFLEEPCVVYDWAQNAFQQAFFRAELPTLGVGTRLCDWPARNVLLKCPSELITRDSKSL